MHFFLVGGMRGGRQLIGIFYQQSFFIEYENLLEDVKTMCAQKFADASSLQCRILLRLIVALEKIDSKIMDVYSLNENWLLDLIELIQFLPDDWIIFGKVFIKIIDDAETKSHHQPNSFSHTRLLLAVKVILARRHFNNDFIIIQYHGECWV